MEVSWQTHSEGHASTWVTATTNAATSSGKGDVQPRREKKTRRRRGPRATPLVSTTVLMFRLCVVVEVRGEREDGRMTAAYLGVSIRRL